MFTLRASSIRLESYILEIQPHLRTKLIRDHKERNAYLLTFWRRDLDVETLGSLNFRFLSIQGHTVLDHVAVVHVDRRGIAIARQKKKRILRLSKDLRDEAALQKIAVEVLYRMHCTRRDGHSATVTNTVELATLRGEHLAYLGQLDHDARPHRCGTHSFHTQRVLPESHLSVSTWLREKKENAVKFLERAIRTWKMRSFS